MLREAELLGMAEVMLVEVLGRIRDEDRAIVVPPLFDLPGVDHAVPLGRAVEVHAYDDACVPAVLAGRLPGIVDRADVENEVRSDPEKVVARLAQDARTAAADVVDADALVSSRYGEMTTRRYLLRVTVTRSLFAHYVAAYLGSTACPLPEELARPLWELTAPDAAQWRADGVFLEPLPIPDKASWRDVFLRTAGHEPHPLGH